MKGIRSLLAWIQRFSLLRNSIYIIGTGTATSVLGYFFWILAAHLYTASAVGLGSALISAMTLAALLANMGMGPTLVQLLPGRKNGTAWSLTVNAGLITGIVAGLLVGIIAVMALPLFSSQFSIIILHPGYALAFILSIPLMSVSTLLDQTFVAERATQHMLIRNALVALLKYRLSRCPSCCWRQLADLASFWQRSWLWQSPLFRHSLCRCHALDGIIAWPCGASPGRYAPCSRRLPAIISSTLVARPPATFYLFLCWYGYQQRITPITTRQHAWAISCS